MTWRERLYTIQYAVWFKLLRWLKLMPCDIAEDILVEVQQAAVESAAGGPVIHDEQTQKRRARWLVQRYLAPHPGDTSVGCYTCEGGNCRLTF